MLGEALIVTFIPTTDLDRARSFYEGGVWTAPGGGRIAWFSDPDDNVLSLTEL